MNPTGAAPKGGDGNGSSDGSTVSGVIGILQRAGVRAVVVVIIATVAGLLYGFFFYQKELNDSRHEIANLTLKAAEQVATASESATRISNEQIDALGKLLNLHIQAFDEYELSRMDANLAQRNVDLATRDEQLNIREQELKATTDKLQRQYAELEEVRAQTEEARAEVEDTKLALTERVSEAITGTPPTDKLDESAVKGAPGEEEQIRRSIRVKQTAGTVDPPRGREDEGRNWYLLTYTVYVD